MKKILLLFSSINIINCNSDNNYEIDHKNQKYLIEHAIINFKYEREDIPYNPKHPFLGSTSTSLYSIHFEADITNFTNENTTGFILIDMNNDGKKVKKNIQYKLIKQLI